MKTVHYNLKLFEMEILNENCPKSKDIQFTVTYIEEKHQIFASETLKPVNVWQF